MPINAGYSEAYLAATEPGYLSTYGTQQPTRTNQRFWTEKESFARDASSRLRFRVYNAAAQTTDGYFWTARLMVRIAGNWYCTYAGGDVANTDFTEAVEFLVDESTKGEWRTLTYVPGSNFARGNDKIELPGGDIEALLRLLTSIKGKFLLSSYPSPLLQRYAKENNWYMWSV